MRLEDAGAAALIQLEGEAAPAGVPATVAGMVELFGGGVTGRSALARELAAATGVKYASARRNVERYTTQRGEQQRTPKRLQSQLERIAGREVQRGTINRARARGVTVQFSGHVKISQDERPREFTVTIEGADLAPFLAEAGAHHWKAAADELNYAVLDAWDGGRGGIVGHGGVITDVDTLDMTFGE